MSDRPQPLSDLRVVDLSSGIAGGYFTKLFADAGADVIKVEPPGGDPLRRWHPDPRRESDGTNGLFEYLHGGQRSVVGDPDDPEVAALIGSAEIVVDTSVPTRLDIGALRG